MTMRGSDLSFAATGSVVTVVAEAAGMQVVAGTVPLTGVGLGPIETVLLALGIEQGETSFSIWWHFGSGFPG